jgi:Tol biopolymer transport system component
MRKTVLPLASTGFLGALAALGSLLLIVEPTQTAFPGQNGKVNANGTGDTRLTTDPAHDAFPTFAPDNTRIVFASDRDGDWDLYAMDADGKNVTQLTNNPARDTTPDWQPIQ